MEKLNAFEKMYSYKKVGILCKIGNTYQYLLNYSEALKNYQLAFSIAYKDSSFLNNIYQNPNMQNIEADKTIIKLLILKSNTLYRLSQKNKNQVSTLREALKTYVLAIKTIDGFRHKISTDDFKEFFVNDVREMYENAVKACFSAYQYNKTDSILELAFFFIEKSKNQVLMDALHSFDAKKYTKVPDSLIQQDELYKNKIVGLQNRLYQLKNNDAQTSLIENCQYEYVKTQQLYSEFIANLENKYPDYYYLKYNINVPSLKETRNFVNKNLFVEYLMGEDFIGIIAGNEKKIIFKQAPVAQGFYELLEQFINSIANKNIYENCYNLTLFKNFIFQSNTLYNILLKPILDEFNNVNQILIIPDHKLCMLPFDILIENIPSDTSSIDYRNLSYVLRNYAIRYEYTAELLVGKCSQRNNKSYKNNYIGFAPDYKKCKYNISQTYKKYLAILRPLGSNKIEVKNSTGLFKGKAFLGNYANKINFKNEITCSKIIHIAAHAIINDTNPNLSGIFFSSIHNNINDTINEDNVLYLDEIYNLKLNSDLVLLSACETGSGKLLKGEGIISLGRAFKYAGCPNIAMSLWKTNDCSTADIMFSFCKHLKRGERKDVALRNAKLDYLYNHEEIANVHPYYWSAFILIGDNEPLFINKKKTVLVLFSILLLLLTTTLIYKKRKIFNLIK